MLHGEGSLRPISDRILIAPRVTFRSDESFTRVLLHEMAHSTGHPSALDRPSNTDFGSPEYAKEELVAELGSLFASADLGIQSADMEGEFYENHVPTSSRGFTPLRTTRTTSSSGGTGRQGQRLSRGAL